MTSDERVLFETLYSKYRKVAISKKEMSLETGQSISTLDRLRKSGVGCAYIKKGNGVKLGFFWTHLITQKNLIWI